MARAAELADRKAAREAIDKTAIKKMNREGLLGIINEFSVLHNVPHSDESGLPLNQPHVSGKATERGTPSLDGTPFTHSKQKKSDRSW